MVRLRFVRGNPIVLHLHYGAQNACEASKIPQDRHSRPCIQLQFTDSYQPLRAGMFLRRWSLLDDSAEAQSTPDLFNPTPQPKRDAVPLHYSELAAHPEPTRAATLKPLRKGA